MTRFTISGTGIEKEYIEDNQSTICTQDNGVGTLSATVINAKAPLPIFISEIGHRGEEKAKEDFMTKAQKEINGELLRQLCMFFCKCSESNRLSGSVSEDSVLKVLHRTSGNQDKDKCLLISREAKNILATEIHELFDEAKIRESLVVEFPNQYGHHINHFLFGIPFGTLELQLAEIDDLEFEQYPKFGKLRSSGHAGLSVDELVAGVCRLEY